MNFVSGCWKTHLPLFVHRLFELEPRTKPVFGFGKSAPRRPSKTENVAMMRAGALVHGMRIVNMFDSALNMLGPDQEMLIDIMQRLGRRHVAYGVSPHFLPFMGRALILTLSEFLGELEWSEALENAWYEVYCELSGVMMKELFDQGRNDSLQLTPN